MRRRDTEERAVPIAYPVAWSRGGEFACNGGVGARREESTDSANQIALTRPGRPRIGGAI